VTATRAVSRRPLRADSVATRQRVIDAAVRLASTRPVDSVTVRDVAREAGVSPATAYTYFASKEHLYAEAYLDGVRVLTESVRARPPRGATAADRIAAVVRRAVRGAGATGDVVLAAASAMASSDPAVATLRPVAEEAFAEWIDVALAGTVIVDHAETVRLVQLTMLATFLAVAHGRLALAEAGRLLDTAVRRLVVER